MGSNTTPLKPAALSDISRELDALRCLREWQRAGTILSFVYARSLGGLVQTGHGRIASLSDAALTVDAGGSSLFVVLLHARFDDSPQIFFTANLSGHFQIPGVSISLGNHDWLFFSADQVPKEAVLARDNVPKIG